ncbi:hypothetical protein AAG906_021854 [Vitis piasezkii]
MQANDILVDYVNGLHPILSMKWSEYALGIGSSLPCSEENICSGDPKSENSGTLNGCMMFLNKSMSNHLNFGYLCFMHGDCGMFLIKYAEYLMHDHPFSSLTDVCIDWFREKMATELFYFKNLPM